MKHEPRVTLAELGMERMTAAEIKAWSGLTSVEVLPDYLDRPSISMEAAYAIAERRRKAEAEFHESERRREIEHREAVEDLQKRVNAAFVEARTAALAASIGSIFSGPVQDAQATNSGLEAARAVWLTAAPAIRDGVPSIEYAEGGINNVVSLNTVIPLDIVSTYATKAARRH